MINTEAIKKILPHGACKEIAIRSNVTIFTVSRVLNGTSNNYKVLKNMKDYIEEVQKTGTDLNSLIAESQTV